MACFLQMINFSPLTTNKYDLITDVSTRMNSTFVRRGGDYLISCKSYRQRELFMRIFDQTFLNDGQVLLLDRLPPFKIVGGYCHLESVTGEVPQLTRYELEHEADRMYIAELFGEIEKDEDDDFHISRLFQQYEEDEEERGIENNRENEEDEDDDFHISRLFEQVDENKKKRDLLEKMKNFKQESMMAVKWQIKRKTISDILNDSLVSDYITKLIEKVKRKYEITSLLFPYEAAPMCPQNHFIRPFYYPGRNHKRIIALFDLLIEVYWLLIDRLNRRNMKIHLNQVMELRNFELFTEVAFRCLELEPHASMRLQWLRAWSISNKIRQRVGLICLKRMNGTWYCLLAKECSGKYGHVKGKRKVNESEVEGAAREGSEELRSLNEGEIHVLIRKCNTKFRTAQMVLYAIVLNSEFEPDPPDKNEILDFA